MDQRGEQAGEPIDQAGILIRPATRKDRPFICTLSKEVFSPYGNYEHIIPRLFMNPDVLTLVSFEKMQPLGFIMLSVLSGEIMAIAVKPRYQSRGIGTALLNNTESIAKRLGMKKLLLHTAVENEIGGRFFQKASFSVINKEESYYPKGQGALVMAKEL
ncbi:MAG: GNAT family N-acetyltransferase [Thermodesulfobacteriota bacterium]